jgi:hypothetical protein
MPLPKSEELVVWKATISEPPVSLFVESASDKSFQLSLIDHQTDMFYNFLPLEDSRFTASMRGMLGLIEAIKDHRVEKGM